MTPERWARVKEIFSAAQEKPEAERADFLDEACGTDTALRQQVQRLLREQDRTELESPVAGLLKQAAAPDLVAGSMLSHYRVEEKLGEGGMAVVYKAEDTKLKRTVALKFLAPSALGNERTRARFFREAQAAGALDHPNICTVYDIEETEGRTFIVMTYVDGESLRQRIRSGPLSLYDSFDIGIQIGQGLEAAHEMGIVHRDVKSGNVLITRKGVAKICDFGLALLADRSRLTPVGTVLGTVPYMSPEQALSKKVDHRTDIWSLGVVLYEMLAGHTPFRGNNAQSVIRAILKQHPPPMSGVRPQVPLDLDRVLDKTLAKHIEERYQHVDDLLVDLRALRRQLPPDTRENQPQKPRGFEQRADPTDATITLEGPLKLPDDNETQD